MKQKKILITGKNSYIGTSFEKWLAQYGEAYIVDTVSTLNDDWNGESFSGYDTVFHVAGIAHVDTKNDMEELYYRVNRELAIKIATKAKNDGVKQFIFMSSIIIYGDSSKTGDNKSINKDTVPKPANFYGISKLEAEAGIRLLQSENFNVVILRPPMIYGKGSKGNYPKLVKLARISPLFPDIENQRSMLYIKNHCEFVRLIIDNNEHGIFFPQNKEYVSTTELVTMIARAHGKRMYTTKLFNPLIRLFSRKLNVVQKVFGNLIYDKKLSDYQDFKYCITSFEQSIEATER